MAVSGCPRPRPHPHQLLCSSWALSAARAAGVLLQVRLLLVVVSWVALTGLPSSRRPSKQRQHQSLVLQQQVLVVLLVLMMMHLTTQWKTMNQMM